VSQLSEQYDAHAIAAAALQIAYDQTRPAWLQSEADFPEEDITRPAPKPKLRGGRREGGGENRSRRSSWVPSEAGATEGEKRGTPKPKLRTGQREPSMSPKKLGSHTARESAS
jgi:ATP-dependent RNA helicase DeaD